MITCSPEFNMAAVIINIEQKRSITPLIMTLKTEHVANKTHSDRVSNSNNSNVIALTILFISNRKKKYDKENQMNPRPKCNFVHFNRGAKRFPEGW